MDWLAERLTELMADRGLTVDAVARSLAIERTRLKSIMAGTATPNENLIKRLANVFGEDAEEWLSRGGQGKSASAINASLPTDFVKVAQVSDVPEGGMRVVFNNLVVVARADGALHAFGNVCPHAGGPIGVGVLKGCVVKCPWHAGRWDIRTGKTLTLIATADIPVFEVRAVGVDIEVKLNQGVFAQGSVSPCRPENPISPSGTPSA